MSSDRSARPAANGAARTRDQAAERRWSKAPYVALFVVLTLIAVQCARLGVAGLYVQAAQFEAERWTATSRTPGMAEIGRIAKYYADGLEYAANNPWALEGLGALDLASMRASGIPREALAAARDAHTRFRRALAQRPTSPFLWANLALTKLYLDEIDSEMLAALRHADELGPWEPTVQQTILFVGLAAWHDLDPGLRQALARTVERGASRNPRQMFDIAKSYGRFDLVCAMEQYSAVGGPDCAKAATAAASGVLVKQGYRP